MATGIPKTKWNGRIPSHTNNAAGNSLDVHLAYDGRTSEAEVLNTAPANTHLLWGSIGSPNRLYFGDNLHVLAALGRDPSVRGQVRLVYIDPPFSTKGVFKSRSQADAYLDLLAGAHYIEFLRKRLILLRELLAEDGSIYVHLDDNMAFHIKLVMDEVFGQKNFRNWITRQKCHNKNYTRRTYGNISDFILFYSKTDTYVWNRSYEPWNMDRTPKEYRYVEEGTGRRYMKVPVHAPGVRNGETGKPWRGKLPPFGKHWQFPPAVLDEMDARGEIYWSPNGNPRRKVYFDQSQGIPVQDIWTGMLDAHNQNIEITGYPTEKNPEVLRRIIQASSDEEDLVLDCFSGSGTTAAQASGLGRRWICIDNSVEAIRTTLHRFAHGTEKMGDYVSGSGDASSAQETLPLWGNQQTEADTSKRLSSAIQDLALLAVTPYAGELDSIIAQWQEWLNP